MARRKTLPRKTDRERELDKEIADLDAVASEARDTGTEKNPRRPAYGAAVQAISKAGELRSARERRLELRRLETVDDPIERVAMLRRVAEREGSWTAVEKLVAREHDMRTKRAAEERLRAREQLANADEQELIETVLDVLDVLPPDVLRNIRDIVKAQLSLHAEAG